MEKRIASISLEVTADGVIESMTIEEVDGARTNFAFMGEQPDAPVNESDFTFRPPPGVPVVQGLPPV
jgi:outer membrane lipoprotein carrier protein